MGKPVPPRGPYPPPPPPPPRPPRPPSPGRSPTLTPLPTPMSTPTPEPPRTPTPEQWVTVSFTGKIVVQGRETAMALFKLPDGTAFEAAVCDCVTMHSEAFKKVEIAKRGKVQPFSRERVKAGEFRPPLLTFVREGPRAGMTQLSCPYEAPGKTFGCEFTVFAEHLPEIYRKQVYSYALSGRITTPELPQLLRLWFYLASRNDPEIENRHASTYITEERHIPLVNKVLEILVKHSVQNRKLHPETDYRDAIKIIGTVSYFLNRWHYEKTKEARDTGKAPRPQKRPPTDHPEPNRAFGKRTKGGYGMRRTEVVPSSTLSSKAVEPFTVSDGHPEPPSSDPVWQALDPTLVDDWDFGKFAEDVNSMFKEKWRSTGGAGVGRLGGAEDLAAALTVAINQVLREVYPPGEAPRVVISSGLLFADTAPPSPAADEGAATDNLGPREKAHARVVRARGRVNRMSDHVENLRRKLAAAEAVATLQAAELAEAEEAETRLDDASPSP